MNRQEAVKVLLRAGKHETLMSKIEDYSGRAARSYGDTRGNAAWSDDYKRWMIAGACTQLLRSLTNELVREAGSVVQTDRNDAAKVFGTAGLPGDAASLTISRRDAADRVAGISKPSELRDVVDRATRSGDEVLARAAAERAMELGDANTLNRFTESRPQLEDAVERMWNAERAGSDTIGVSMALLGLQPEEFSGQSFDSIETVSQNQPGAA